MINPYLYEPPISPNIAAELVNEKLSTELVVKKIQLILSFFFNTKYFSTHKFNILLLVIQTIFSTNFAQVIL